MQRPAPAPRERGFALLIVLLTLGFLSLIVTRELADSRLEAQLALAAQMRAQDDASLDSAAQTALFHLITPGNLAWARNSRHVVTADHDTAIGVTIHALDTRIPLNAAGTMMIAGMLQVCRLSPDASMALARAITAWRDPQGAREARASYRGALWAPPGVPFHDVADLRFVRGMTEPLLACLSPHLSVYQRDMPHTDSPDPAVHTALQLAQTAATADAPTIADPADEQNSPGGPGIGAQANAAAGSVSSPIIGGASEPAMRIDLDLTRGSVHRHVALVATVSDPNDPTPIRILAWEPGEAPELR